MDQEIIQLKDPDPFFLYWWNQQPEDNQIIPLISQPSDLIHVVA